MSEASGVSGSFVTDKGVTDKGVADGSDRRGPNRREKRKTRDGSHRRGSRNERPGSRPAVEKRTAGLTPGRPDHLSSVRAFSAAPRMSPSEAPESDEPN